MSKMMMTPAGATGRSATADLLSLSNLGRPAPDSGDSPETAGGFARLLQANAQAVASSQSRSAALSAAPAHAMAQAQAPTPPAPTQPPAATKAPDHPQAEASAAPSPTEATPSQDATRAAQRRAADANSRNAPRRTDDSAPTQADDSTDPVLAQVLRHLRGHAGASDATDETETTEELGASKQDAVDDAAATLTDPALAPMQGPAAQSAQPLPPGADAALRAQTASAESGLAGNGRSSKDLALAGEGNSPDALSADAELRQWRDARATDRAAGLGAGHPSAPVDGQAAVRGQAADTADSLQGISTKAAVEGAAAAKSDALSGLPGGFAGILHQAQAGNVADKGATERLGGARYELQSPLHSTGFAPEMAARLSLAAADGVQQAQLHLNPAEMGPVQVQIVLDGQQAQISFVAEQADTRAVLEKSLPELAGALREQGLTLSGGGVFSQQQAPQDPNAQANAQEGRPSQRWSGARVDDTAIEDPAALRVQAPVTRARGVLDLFA